MQSKLAWVRQVKGWYKADDSTAGLTVSAGVLSNAQVCVTC